MQCACAPAVAPACRRSRPVGHQLAINANDHVARHQGVARVRQVAGVDTADRHLPVHVLDQPQAQLVVLALLIQPHEQLRIVVRLLHAPACGGSHAAYTRRAHAAPPQPSHPGRALAESAPRDETLRRTIGRQP
eukprot:scaffold14984_cov69-Phaeocystis_antarctica.AAC.11